jgi:predicted ATPase
VLYECWLSGVGGATKKKQEAMSVEDLTAKIPVTILTGFLGSGKTTVLSQLVKSQTL